MKTEGIKPPPPSVSHYHQHISFLPQSGSHPKYPLASRFTRRQHTKETQLGWICGTQAATRTSLREPPPNEEEKYSARTRDRDRRCI